MFSLRRLNERERSYSRSGRLRHAKESRVSKAELGIQKANVAPQKLVREFRLKVDLPEGE